MGQWDRLTERALIPYLVERELLGAQDIVEGDVELANTSRRNLSFRVTTKDERGCLVKQGVGAERGATIAREAEFLIAAANAPNSVRWLGHLPAVRDWHSERRILVFSLVPGAHSLAERHARASLWPAGLAWQVGRALRRLHTWSPAIQTVALPLDPPRILSIHRPDLPIVDQVSDSGLEVIKIVQDTPELCSAFDDLSLNWQSSRVIHGDVKWDNVVLLPTPGGRRFRVLLVDWELVQLGDPLWDAASFLCQYLDTWIASMPILAQSPRSGALSAGIPLERLQPAMRRFWDGYMREMGTEERAVALERVVRYAAARLVQFAIEADQQSALLSATGVVRLQVAHNMVQRPLAAATSLLGFAA